MEECILTVRQNSNIVRFEFNDEADAIKFADLCLECSERGTEVSMVMKEVEQ